MPTFGMYCEGQKLAKALGVSEDHAKKPVKRAMQRLRHILLALAEEPHSSHR